MRTWSGRKRCSRDSSNSKPPWAPSSSRLPCSNGSWRKRSDCRTCRRVDACGHGRGEKLGGISPEKRESFVKLSPRPVRRSRSREDFLDLCLVGGKVSLQVRTQKRKPVISPKDLVVYCKGWDTEHPGLNCAFRLKTKPFFNFNRLGLAQKLLSIDADTISNFANDSIRGDIFTLTPGSIKKSHRKAFSKTIIVECRRDTKSFERVKGMCWWTLELQS